VSQFDTESHLVPHQLEHPIPIMFWSPLEFVMAVSLMGFGVVMSLWVVGMGAGVAVLVGARYLKRGNKRGSTQHLLWSLGLQLDPALAKHFTPAWVNEFVE